MVSQFSKEKAIFNQLVLYLESNELIHPNLHGSRAGHSTATALGQLYDTWVEEVEEGKMAQGDSYSRVSYIDTIALFLLDVTQIY